MDFGACSEAHCNILKRYLENCNYGTWILEPAVKPLYCFEEGSKKSSRNRYFKIIVIMANGFSSQHLSLCTMLRKEVRKSVETGM